MNHRTSRFLACAAASVFAAGTATAQFAPSFELRSFAATSMADDVTELLRADSLIAERLTAGELALVSSRPDRALPGRIHEHFGQLHHGVPVHGAGFTRQRVHGATASVFGGFLDGIDIDVVPSLDARAALDLLEATAGTAPATSAPPSLTIYLAPTGRPALTWSAPMRDYRTHFIDAHSGEPVARHDHMRQDSAVGFGTGITGAPQKLSVWRTDEGFQAWDRLRPGELVTIDVDDEGLLGALPYLIPSPAWLDAVAADEDNEWSSPAIVDGHANLGFTYDYLHESHGWQGHDGQNSRLISLVNLREFENAFFLSPPFGPQGGGVLGFGELEDGPPLVSLDVVAHEYQHAVTHASLVARTGLPLLDTHGYVPGPSSFEFRGEVYRCGDMYTFPGPPREVMAPFFCVDDEGNVTRSRSGRFALFMNHGGAINEAYSDIIATSVEFATHPPGDGLQRADYLLGEDVGEVIRRMDTPGEVAVGGLLPFPDAADQVFRFLVASVGENLIRYTGFIHKEGRFYRAPSDGYSGEHWNSTLLSHAFFLAIEGGTHSSGQAVQGVGPGNRLLIEQAFFRAMVDLTPARVGLTTMGLVIRQAALDLHGAGSPAFVAVDQALSAVGI